MDKKQFFNNLFEPYFHTFQSMDGRMIGIMQHREEYEKRLDDMWQNYCRGCMMQVVNYKGQVKYIKEAGLKCFAASPPESIRLSINAERFFCLGPDWKC